MYTSCRLGRISDEQTAHEGVVGDSLCTGLLGMPSAAFLNYPAFGWGWLRSRLSIIMVILLAVQVPLAVPHHGVLRTQYASCSPGIV